MTDLSDTTLVMLISPSAMGKSTIIHEVLSTDTLFRRVRSFTTRPPRPNDEPNQFFYFSQDELSARRQAGEIISEVTFPTTGQTYGTITDSYAGSYCVLETLSNSVDQYRALGFKHTVTISITADPATWRKRFLERYPEPTDEAINRLDEARMSMHWSLSQGYDNHWLINNSAPNSVARRLIEIVVDGLPGDDGAQTARGCLDVIDTLY